ncbi:MAG: hypothetical protein ACLTZM_08365 [Ruminococcus sp.]
MKASQNRAYAQKVKISNLQQMAKTIAYVQEHHYDTRESLQMSFEEISEKWKESRKAVKSTEEKIKEINEQIHYAGQYLANKPVFAQMLKTRNKKNSARNIRRNLNFTNLRSNFSKRKCRWENPVYEIVKSGKRKADHSAVSAVRNL